MTWAKVGMKVVCVDASGVRSIQKPLELGAIYTVREISICMRYGDTGIILDEIFNEAVDGFNLELGYFIRRFRPLIAQTIEDDIAVFKLIADNAPSLEDERA